MTLLTNVLSQLSDEQGDHVYFQVIFSEVRFLLRSIAGFHPSPLAVNIARSTFFINECDYYLYYYIKAGPVCLIDF